MKHYLILITALLLFSCEDLDTGEQAYEFKVLEDIYVDDTSFKVFGYLPNYRYIHIDQIDFSKINYLCFIRAYPTSTGELAYDNESEMDAAIQSVKEKNPNLKIFMSLSSGPSEIDVWVKYLKHENRTAFIENIIDFVKRHNLDGIDVDLEGNVLPKIIDDYGPFIRHLRNDLHGNGKAITAALPATRSHSIKIETLQSFDFINIMSYGKGNMQSYATAESAVKYWTQTIEIPKEKLVLGVPFFGWTTADQSVAYTYENVLKEDINNAFSDNLGVNNHNGIPTIVNKTLLAKEKLNGIMIWELGQDSFDELSLLSAIDQTLAADCTGSIATFFKDADGDGFGDIRKPYQACEAPENYVDNDDDCNDEDPSIGKCN